MSGWVMLIAVFVVVWMIFGRRGSRGARILRGPELWTGSSPSKGTQRNRRMRGQGTWGQEVRNLNEVEQKKLRKQRGMGNWSKQSAKLYRQQRRREREERRSRNLLYKLLG